MLKCCICFQESQKKLFILPDSKLSGCSHAEFLLSPSLSPFLPQQGEKFHLNGEVLYQSKKSSLLKQNCCDFFKRKQSLLICYLSNWFYICLIVPLSPT